jgi:uncharacterized protein YggT (Ycf19 family)
MLHETSERFLRPFRAMLRPIGLGGEGGIGLDVSPVVAYLIVEIVYATLVGVLRGRGII